MAANLIVGSLSNVTANGNANVSIAAGNFHIQTLVLIPWYLNPAGTSSVTFLIISGVTNIFQYSFQINGTLLLNLPAVNAPLDIVLPRNQTLTCRSINANMIQSIFDINLYGSVVP